MAVLSACTHMQLSSNARPHTTAHHMKTHMCVHACAGQTHIGENISDDTEDTAKSLHPKIVAMLTSGFLESQRQLTAALMHQEWAATVRPWARRKGVADFAKQAAEKQVPVEWEALQALYRDPSSSKAAPVLQVGA